MARVTDSLLSGKEARMTEDKKRTRIEGVVFDIGDTLLETGSLMRSGAEYAAQKLFEGGIISNSSELPRVFLMTDEKTKFPHISHLFSHAQIALQALEESGTLTTRFSPLVATHAFLSYYRLKIRQEIYPRQEVLNLLESLKARRLKLGIISNGSLEDQIEVLVRLEITGYFDSILVSEEVKIEKPDKRIFKLSAAELGLSAPSILFVGDDWETDIQGALDAGFQAACFGQFKSAHLNPGFDRTGCSFLERIEDVNKLVAQRPSPLLR